MLQKYVGYLKIAEIVITTIFYLESAHCCCWGLELEKLCNGEKTGFIREYRVVEIV